MTAIKRLEAYGVTPRLKPDGRLTLQGVGKLPENVKTEVVTWARENRGTILQELSPNVFNGFTEKGAPLKIEVMENCLHGGKCKHLDAPGETRPICSKVGEPVFDLRGCPANKWLAPGAQKNALAWAAIPSKGTI
jgi:hypothetical protein